MCENDDTFTAALMNYLEAEGGLGDPGELSDIQWTLYCCFFIEMRRNVSSMHKNPQKTPQVLYW